jgi:hypothetical protein
MTALKMSKGGRRVAIAAVIAAGYAVGTVVAVRKGYAFGLSVPVRCRRGHVFSTTWIPGASVKSLRLGLWRVQWCPVGRHVDLVRLVRSSDLSASERQFAAEHHDVRVP